MKKLLFIVSFLLCAFVSFSQSGFPNTQSIANSATLYTIKGGARADSGFSVISFPDTATANLGSYIKNTDGIVIRVQDSMFIRVYSEYRWVNIGGGGTTINPGGGIDSIIVTGDVMCVWRLGVPTCYNLGRYFNDVEWNYDSTKYVFFYNGNALDSVTILKSVIRGVAPIVITRIIGTNGIDTFEISSTGGGGGGTQTLQQVFDTEIGGSVLSKIDSINTSGFAIRLFGTSGTPFRINNTGGNGLSISTTGNSIDAFSSGSTSISGFSTAATGVQGSSTNSFGGNFISTNSYAIHGQTSTATTTFATMNLERSAATANTVLPIIQILRATSGAAANGIGTSIEFFTETTGGGVTSVSNSLVSRLTDAAAATVTSEFIITGLNSAVPSDLLTISGSGSTQLNKYGIGTFTGTKAYDLGVDASGNIIETTGGSFTDSAAYHTITQIDDSTFSLNRPDGTKDTVTFSGGGSGDVGNTIYTGSDTIRNDDRVVELDSKILSFQQGGVNFLKLEGVAGQEEIILDAHNTTDGGNDGKLSLQTTNTEADFHLRADFNDGTKVSAIHGYANTTESYIEHLADIHTFIGQVQIVDGTESAGYVFTDVAGDGVGSWQPAAGGGGSGTVTNVATGLGLSGGPITTTGTILVDTASASILSRQRAAATYEPIFSVLPIAKGGTNNGSLSVTAGTIYYGDGTKLVGLAPGTAAQHLTGGTTPSWKDTAVAGGAGGGLADSAYFWQLLGNAPAYNTFLGTTTNRSMRFRAKNVQFMVGDSATANVGIGGEANSLYKLAVTGTIHATASGGIAYSIPNGTSLRGTSSGATNIYLDGNTALTGTINVRATTFQIEAATNGTTFNGSTFTATTSGGFKINGLDEFNLKVDSTLFRFNDNTSARKIGYRAATNWFRDDNSGIAGWGEPHGSAIMVLESTTRAFMPPRMTKTQRDAIVMTGAGAGTTAVGSGLTNGIYPSVALTGGTGTGAIAKIVVISGIVNQFSLIAVGTGYTVADVLTSTLMGGSGFSYTLTSLSGAPGMVVYQTDNTPGQRTWNGTNWMRYTETAD